MVVGASHAHLSLEDKVALCRVKRKEAACVVARHHDGLCEFDAVKNAVSDYARDITYIDLGGVVQERDREIAAVVAEGGAKYGMDYCDDPNRIQLVQDQARSMFDKMAEDYGRAVDDTAKKVSVVAAQAAYDLVMKQAEEDFSEGPSAFDAIGSFKI